MREEIHMKKQKVCALLCVAAMTISSVTPAMAADSAVTPQEENVITEEVEEAADPVEEDSQEVETTVDGTEEEQEDTGDESETSGEPQQDQEEPEADTESTPETTEQDVTDSQEADTNADERAIPTEGWYTDANGKTFFYENGEKLVETIVEIEDEEGLVYGYYFDEDGILVTNGCYFISYETDDGQWEDGYIYADEEGHLLKGWYTKDSWNPEYYGEDYLAYQNRFLEEDGKLYYFDEGGYRVKGREIIIGGVLYKADEDGALTVQEVSDKNGWQLVGNTWYYYKDGKVLKDTYATINGAQYYFDSDGAMVTGVFYDEELGDNRFAEPSGKIVNATGWYQSKETGKWYWFEKAGIVLAGALETIKGKEFYFSEEGEMMTGTFQASYVNKNSEWVTEILYADQYGAISRTPGWKNDNGSWSYVNKNGEVVSNGIVDINGKSYRFDQNGIMESGDIYPYLTDSSGAIIKNQWVKNDVYWYYTGNDGRICTNQWINGTYYVGEYGVMVTGSYTINGKCYIFDENGKKVATVGEKNGWQLIEGEWFYTENGVPYNGWLNHKYYLENGRMETECMVPAEHVQGASTYVGVDGNIQSGWIGSSDTYWHYAEKDTKSGDILLVQNGWKAINGKWYYFQDFDIVCDKVMEIDGKLSKFAASGAWQGYVTQSGWTKSDSGKWYYINEDGTFASGLKKINGKTYFFWYDSYEMVQNTAIATEYSEKEGERGYWFNADGMMDTTPGWKKDDYGDWYYVEKDGSVAKGKKTINGTTYYFGEAAEIMGVMWQGIWEENGRYFLIDENGKWTSISNGWHLNKEYGGNKWYYFQNGRPYTGNVGRYAVDHGEMITGMREGYMFDDNGLLITNRWVYLSNTWYYAGSTGKLYTGTRTVNGKTYLFDRSGALIK